MFADLYTELQDSGLPAKIRKAWEALNSGQLDRETFAGAVERELQAVERSIQQCPNDPLGERLVEIFHVYAEALEWLAELTASDEELSEEAILPILERAEEADLLLQQLQNEAEGEP